jgi:hypothetical protein
MQVWENKDDQADAHNPCQTLDADDQQLRANGKVAARDIVQFVPFRKYASDPTALAAEVLAEIPGQILECACSVFPCACFLSDTSAVMKISKLEPDQVRQIVASAAANPH